MKFYYGFISGPFPSAPNFNIYPLLMCISPNGGGPPPAREIQFPISYMDVCILAYEAPKETKLVRVCMGLDCSVCMPLGAFLVSRLNRTIQYPQNDPSILVGRLNLPLRVRNSLSFWATRF